MLSVDAFSRAQRRLVAGLRLDPLGELESSPDATVQSGEGSYF